MRLRTLLATTVAGTLLAGAAGAVGLPAQAARAPMPALDGSLVTWGDTTDFMANAALTIPNDFTAPVADIAANMGATAVVTTDGHLRVWGVGVEVDDAPTNITDAVAVSMAFDHAAVLHADGTISAWGATPEFADVPSTLRAKAIAVSSGGTGYAVKPDGTLTTWGTETFPMPATGLTDLVDVATTATGAAVMALKADGTPIAWTPNPSDPVGTIPDLGGKKVTQIVTGSGANGLVLDDGSIKVWGPSAPTGQPDFGGKKVISLALGFLYTNSIAGAVTEDGVVHTWGASSAVDTHPETIAGKPVTSIELGYLHAAVIVGDLREKGKPSITGTPQVGQTLTAAAATFNLPTDAPATGQWYADAAPIAGQTGTTLTLADAVVGKKISYRSTATRSGKTVTSASNELGPVTAKASAGKAKSTVTATLKATGKTKKLAKKVKVTVTVKTTKGISAAGKVKVTLKGKTKKTITVKVNANGKGTGTFKNVKRGKYKAQLSYAGNSGVSSSKASKSFKV